MLAKAERDANAASWQQNSPHLKGCLFARFSEQFAVILSTCRMELLRADTGSPIRTRCPLLLTLKWSKNASPTGLFCGSILWEYLKQNLFGTLFSVRLKILSTDMQISLAIWLLFLSNFTVVTRAWSVIGESSKRSVEKRVAKGPRVFTKLKKLMKVNQTRTREVCISARLSAVTSNSFWRCFRDKTTIKRLCTLRVCD